MMRKLHRTYTVPASYDAEIDEAMRRLQMVLARVPGERYPVAANDGRARLLPSMRESFYRLENWVHGNWMTALRRPSDNEAESERRRDLALRAVTAHIATVDRIESAALNRRRRAPFRPTNATTIAWVERGDRDARYELNAAPFEVAPSSCATRCSRARPSVVLTSATLAEGRSFAFLRETLGVDAAQELIAPSPFDYPRQARLYIAPA
jgi:Rad3-related DNA helicase